MTVLIVLNYNDCETTNKFVLSILDFESIDKIIVVDNHSTDDSFEKLTELSNAKVDIIQTMENGGYACGNNFGAFYAIEKYNPNYIIIANPDIIIENETILRMVSFADVNSDAGSITCRINCTSGIELPIAWKLPKFLDCILENLILLKKLLGNRMAYDVEYLKKNIVCVDVLPGSFFMIPAKVFAEVDGFDPDTFLYYEENILAFKLKQKKYKSYLLNSDEYLHMHSVSINKNITSVKNRLRISYASRIIYCKKYLKIGAIGSLILKITFEIGLFNYLTALKVMRIKR